VALSAAFGTVPTMQWQVRRTWLVKVMAQAKVECLIIDDAQDLALSHLALLKELTDNLAALPYQRPVALCLVAATSGSIIPFKETFAGPEMLWQQFRRRMDNERPYCLVLGHTEEEVRHILTTSRISTASNYPISSCVAGPSPFSPGSPTQHLIQAPQAA
jgi:hypothetical protein